MTANEIVKAATDFRAAIEATEKKALPASFSNFPTACCGDTALMLGTYLKSLGFGSFNYVEAERGSPLYGTWEGHAWIENAGLIADITADQFSDFKEQIYVGPESSFHSTFEREVPNEADFRSYAAHLSSSYNAIIKNLPSTL